MTVDRRKFLQGIGAATALGLPGGVLLGGGQASAAGSGYFSFADDSSTLFTGSYLSFRSGWQTFGYASHADCFYYLQPCPSKGRGTGIADAMAHGDLRLSSVNTAGTARKDYMQLSGFGHGTAMGIESTSEHSYIWMETTAVADPGSTNVKGKQICVFPWDKGSNRTYTAADVGTSAMPGSAKYTLRTGSTCNSVSVDDVNHRLMLRYKATNGAYYYDLYDLATVRAQGSAAGQVSGFASIRESTVTSGVPGDYQSFALYGDYLYIVTGNQPSSCSSSGGAINSNLIRYRIDGTSAPVVHTTAVAEHAPHREPEGICVYTRGSTRRLCFGIKYTANCDDSAHQKMAVYYKDQYVT